MWVYISIQQRGCLFVCILQAMEHFTSNNMVVKLVLSLFLITQSIFTRGLLADGDEVMPTEKLQPMSPIEYRVVESYVDDARRRLGAPFQQCASCTCCSGSKCTTKSCCYGIKCNLPNKPYGTCAFMPKKCDCNSCS